MKHLLIGLFLFSIPAMASQSVQCLNALNQQSVPLDEVVQKRIQASPPIKLHTLSSINCAEDMTSKLTCWNRYGDYVNTPESFRVNQSVSFANTFLILAKTKTGETYQLDEFEYSKNYQLNSHVLTAEVTKQVIQYQLFCHHDLKLNLKCVYQKSVYQKQNAHEKIIYKLTKVGRWKKVDLLKNYPLAKQKTFMFDSEYASLDGFVIVSNGARYQLDFELWRPLNAHVIIPKVCITKELCFVLRSNSQTTSAVLSPKSIIQNNAQLYLNESGRIGAYYDGYVDFLEGYKTHTEDTVYRTLGTGFLLAKRCALNIFGQVECFDGDGTRPVVLDFNMSVKKLLGYTETSGNLFALGFSGDVRLYRNPDQVLLKNASDISTFYGDRWDPIVCGLVKE